MGKITVLLIWQCQSVRIYNESGRKSSEELIGRDLEGRPYGLI
jgi:hypothetical protein